MDSALIDCVIDHRFRGTYVSAINITNICSIAIVILSTICDASCTGTIQSSSQSVIQLVREGYDKGIQKYEL